MIQICDLPAGWGKRSDVPANNRANNGAGPGRAAPRRAVQQAGRRDQVFATEKIFPASGKAA